MIDNPVDLTNCDREPIHIPGQIQSHGFLVVVDQENNIQFISENAKDYEGSLDSSLLGQSISKIEQQLGVHPNSIIDFIQASISGGTFEPVNPLSVSIHGAPFYLIIGDSANFYLLEFERAFSSFNADVQSMMGRSIAELLKYKKFENLLDGAARQVKKIIGYDRVMIYRFAADGHGEVAAEEHQPELPSWLGLHYPASDIPKQARELYKRNLTRLIADVHTDTAKILTDAENTVPLDLTNSQLRAVSPIHIQYLKNMGVASSFSISIICNEELWGLIACHHYTPKFIDYRSREYAKLVGQILSSALQYREEIAEQHRLELSKSSLAKIVISLQDKGNIKNALLEEPAELLKLAHATGALVIFGDIIYPVGITPGTEEMISVKNWLNTHTDEPVFQTTNLSGIFPESSAYQKVVSGIMALTIRVSMGSMWYGSNRNICKLLIGPDSLLKNWNCKLTVY